MVGRAAEVSRLLAVLERRTKSHPLLVGEPGVGKHAVVLGARPAHSRGKRAAEPGRRAPRRRGYGGARGGSSAAGRDRRAGPTLAHRARAPGLGARLSSGRSAVRAGPRGLDARRSLARRTSARGAARARHDDPGRAQAHRRARCARTPLVHGAFRRGAERDGGDRDRSRQRRALRHASRRRNRGWGRGRFRAARETLRRGSVSAGQRARSPRRVGRLAPGRGGKPCRARPQTQARRRRRGPDALALDGHPRREDARGRGRASCSRWRSASASAWSARTRRSAPSRARCAADAWACATPRSPIGSFLFLGPSGVGKTELAKALAEFLFDDERALTRLDMSEFMERHMAQRLLGAPPGYADSEQGGFLTEAVRRRPYSVLLFDEVEKAHADVFNLLLQVLDDGRLTDGRGRTADFSNTVVIMTSNIGSERILETDDEALRERGGPRRAARRACSRSSGTFFRPEFLNRIDETSSSDRSRGRICAASSTSSSARSTRLLAEKGHPSRRRRRRARSPRRARLRPGPRRATAEARHLQARPGSARRGAARRPPRRGQHRQRARPGRSHSRRMRAPARAAQGSFRRASPP